MIIRLLLLPFAALYKLITDIRNRLYDLKLKPSAEFEIPVIGVGNLAVGGTGKTPMIEYLIRLLYSDYRVATLSRGYGRKTKGMRIANLQDDATTLGDEPFQFYKKFSDNKTIVAVCEDRAFAIPNIIHQFPETQVVLMDDAYQHRQVKPLFNILLTDFNKPFYFDFLLPAGRLRESRRGADRADVIVLTKCPAELSDDEMMKSEKLIRSYADCPVFFTKIRYGFPLSFGNRDDLSENIVLVSGIANSETLKEYIKQNFKLMKHIAYGDHHPYSSSDLNDLLSLVKNDSSLSILTTEKDMVKIISSEFESIVKQIPFFYLPIETEFIKSGKDFEEMVQNVFNHAANN